MRPAYLRRSLFTLCATGLGSLGAIAAVGCHGDGRDPGANNRAATYVTPASNLPAPAVAPATNTPGASGAAGAPMTTPSANTNPAAQPRPSDSTLRDTTRAPNRTDNKPTNVAEPKRS